MSSKHLDPEGKSVPMTVISSIAHWKKAWALIVLKFFRFFMLNDVRSLRFIHFAQWTRLPSATFFQHAPQGARFPRRSFLLFTTNYNGPWEQYLDSFLVLRRVRFGMNQLWGTSEKWPGAYPVRRSKRFNRYHEYQVTAYYNAYPNASIRDIERALSVKEEIANVLTDTHFEYTPGAAPSLSSSLLERVLRRRQTAPAACPTDDEVFLRIADAVAPLLASTNIHQPELLEAFGPTDLQL